MARTERQKRWEAANPERVRRYKRESYARSTRPLYDARRKEHGRWLAVIRAEVGCERCGAKGCPVHFHHRNPAEKKALVSQLVEAPYQTLVREIEKCEILCEPCHYHEHRSRGSMTKQASGYTVTYSTTSREQAEQILALIRDATA